ncbi:glycosyltransferase family 2 protein [Clostridium sp. CTA-5]
MRFSIITVCYNCEKLIKQTIESVMNQEFKDYEMIFIDGKSKDSTLKIIENYSKKFKHFKLLSEEDDGIYDAMNKGIYLADGEILFFLNAGDIFYNNMILEKIDKKFNDCDILYGNYKVNNLIINNDKEKINKLFFIREKMLCHQTIFASKKCFENNLFDLNYKVCADRYWLINNFKNNRSFKYIDEIISVYDCTGFSTSEESIKLISKESINILKKQFNKKVVILIYIKRILGNIKRRLKSLKDVKNV